jgi:membrane protease YdiL (CAAX protease family)
MINRLVYNPAELRLRLFWRLLFQLLSLILLLMALEGILALWKDQLTHSATLVAEALAGSLAFGLSVWIAGRWLDHRPWADFGFHLSPGWWKQFGFGVALGALLMGIMFLVEYLLGWITMDQVGFTANQAQGLVPALWVAFVSYAGIAFTEEILFRGYLLLNLAEGLRGACPKPALHLSLSTLLTSLLFGLSHAGNPNATLSSTLLLCCLGVFFALGRVLTGELAIPIGLHLAWNFFQGNVFGFTVSGWANDTGSLLQITQGGPVWITGGAFGPEAGLLGLAAMLGGVWLIVLFLRREKLLVV